MDSTSLANRPIRLATAEDLETYRPAIERLYKRMTLPKLIDTLVQDHGLKPTYNMLRKRLRQWGLDTKYNKDRRMRAMARKTDERSRIGKASTFQDRGRSVQYKDVVRYWERRHLSIEDVLAQNTSREPTPDGLEVFTPVPSPVSPPATLATPERILIGLSNYISASFESGTWFSPGENFYCITKKASTLQRSGLNSVYYAVVEACQLFTEGKAQDAGQRLISGTKVVKEFVDAEIPDIFPTNMLVLHISFHWGYPEIGIAIIRLFASWGEVQLGQSHPISQLFALLANSNISQMRDLVERCLCSIKDCFESQLGFYHVTQLHISRMCYQRTLSTKAQTQVMRRILDRLETKLRAHDSRCLDIRVNLASNYVRKRSYDEAEKECSRILDLSRELYNHTVRVYYHATGLYNLAQLHESRKKFDIAEILWKEAIALRISIKGEEHLIVRNWMWGLERMLARRGQVESAAHLERQRMTILAREVEKQRKIEGIEVEL